MSTRRRCSQLLIAVSAAATLSIAAHSPVLAQSIPLGAQCNGGGRSIGSHRLSGALGLVAGGVMTGVGNQIGSGFWTKQLPTSGVHEPPPPVLPLVLEFRATSPNPFTARGVIHYTLSAASHVELALFDVAGRKVRDLMNQNVLPGSYTAVVSGRDLPSGVFFCRLVAKGEAKTLRLVHVE